MYSLLVWRLVRHFVSPKPVYFSACCGVWLSLMMPGKTRLRNDILFVQLDVEPGSVAQCLMCNVEL